MKIGINLTDLIPGKIGGMENYMRSLVYFFPLVSPTDHFFVVGYSDILRNIDLNWCKKIIIKRDENRENLSTILKQVILKNKLDIWFSPLLILDPLDCPIPSGINIPDMQHEYFPDFFDEATLSWRRKYYQLSAEKADLVFTLSNNSRNDIIRFLDVDPKKVKSIYIDTPPWFYKKLSPLERESVKQKYSLPPKYLYYPANTWLHKNHIRLMEAFNKIKDQIPEVNLLFSGYKHLAANDIHQYIEDNKLHSRIKFLGYIETKHVPAIYSNALGLVFPSLFEGFGIPLLEAFRSDCPVLCANNSSIPEIAGEAALYFDGLSVSSIGEAMLIFCRDESLRGKLIKLGHKQVKKFSYRHTAVETLKYLKHMVEDKKIDRVAKIGYVRQERLRWPKISIVTPSFNQGKYIERTIKSVLNQKYPNLEYIVVDGGSTDNTLNILKKYSKEIKWISEKDNGQADAINKGIKMSSGEIVAYLNSDDTYEPGALLSVAKFLKDNPQAKLVYGKGRHIDENDKFIEDYPSRPTDFTHLHPTCNICQPTVFWRRELIEDVGYFDTSLKYAMDYDYWIRIADKYPLNFLYKYLGNTRLYPETKTLGQKVNVHREIIKVQKRYYSRVHMNWILAWVHARLAGNKRRTVLENTIFIIYLILGSFYGFLRFNQELPPIRVWKYYLIWFKELIAFVIRKRYVSFY